MNDDDTAQSVEIPRERDADRQSKRAALRASEFLPEKYNRAIVSFAPRSTALVAAASLVERRCKDDRNLSKGRRAADVPLVMNGEVALLTLEGYLETASCLATIVTYLDRRERDAKAGKP
jgi:hypothetical protein